MYFFRLLKPDWAKKTIKRKEGDKWVEAPNPKFVREIEGPDTVGDFEMPEEDLRALNEAGYNIYHFPNGPSKQPENKFLNGNDIDVFRYVFVDMDLKDEVYASKEAFYEKIGTFPAKPTRVVDSGNGVHVYWAVSDLNREAWMYLQLCLIQHFQTDESIWTPLQLMRFPGYMNTKDPENPKLCSVIDTLSDQTASYTVDQLEKLLPAITEKNMKRLTRHIDKLNGVETEELVTGYDPNDLPARFLEDLRTNKKVQDLFERPKETCGDRSSADMKLANLLFSLDYSKQDALQVLMNSEKARSRSDRQGYAFGTIDKVYRDRPKYTVESAAERKNRGLSVKNLGRQMNGPAYWDCLHGKWRTKQVLGLIAGAGVGKTTVTLDMFKGFIENNPESDDIYIFFSLEMTEGEIYDRWEAATGGNPDYAKRLYVVSNEDDNGEPRHIGLQEVAWFCRDISKSTGKRIGAIAIDHLDALSRHIDLTKKETFNIKGKADKDFVYAGDTVTIGKAKILEIVKEMTKRLDVFTIIQSQTTKTKDGGGDLPLGKNAAYGVSNFEWYADYVMTVWKPLKRVHDRTDLRVTGWQYAKIRSQHRLDGVEEGINQALKFNRDTQSLEPLSDSELESFHALVQQANVLRQKEDKKVTDNYKSAPVVKALNKIFKIHDRKQGA